MERRVQVFGEQSKAMFGAISTFVLLVIVLIQSTMENLVYGRGQMSIVSLTIFTVVALFIVIWFIVRGASDKFAELFTLFSRATRTGIPRAHTDVVLDRVGADRGRFRSAIANLWIPVTLQFMLAGWLIYATGGIMNTPYNPVPIVMMLIGQSIYVTPPIDLAADAKLLDVLVFIWRIARAYLYPQLVFVFILVAVVLLQEHYPLVTRPAPSTEIVTTILVSLFVSMCVVFVTRRVDRGMTQRAR